MSTNKFRVVCGCGNKAAILSNPRALKRFYVWCPVCQFPPDCADSKEEAAYLYAKRRGATVYEKGKDNGGAKS